MVMMMVMVVVTVKVMVMVMAVVVVMVTVLVVVMVMMVMVMVVMMMTTMMMMISPKLRAQEWQRGCIRSISLSHLSSPFESQPARALLLHDLCIRVLLDMCK